MKCKRCNQHMSKEVTHSHFLFCNDFRWQRDGIEFSIGDYAIGKHINVVEIDVRNEEYDKIF